MVRSYVKLYSALSFCIALSVSPSVQAQVPSINKWMSGELAQGFNVGASIGMPSEKIVYFVFPMYDNEAGNAIDQVAYSTLNTDGTWSAPIVMKDPINDPFNNAVVGIDSSGTTLYLLGRYAANPRARIGLSSSSYSNGFWSSPTPVKLRGLNPTTEFYSLYVTPDQQLVFATFEKGREHSDDLFIATYNDEKEGFNKLQRLGAPINTKRSEIAPFYNLQDSTLYFSREVDSGDSVNYDLFYSKPLNSDFTEWSDPMPLETLNSPGFDAYYWEGIDGKAFFTSDRFNVGMTDILTYDARQKEMIPRTEELASDIGTGGEEQAMDETSSFSMVKILEKDEMLIDVSRWSDSASTFDLNIVLKDNQGVPIPEGETFIVRNEAGDVVREERIKENGAMQMKGLVVQPNLHFEIEDMASSDVQMEVLNRFGEVQSSLAILDAEQFVYRKLQYEQFAIELLLNSEDGEIPEDIVRSFLRGDVSSVSIDRSVAEDKGIVPHLTDLSKVILCNASGQRLIPIDVVEFIDRLGNVVERLSPIDNAFNYEDVKDVGATWLRINGNHIVLLSESVTYQSDLDAFGLTYFEIDDLDEIERIKGLIASAQQEVSARIEDAENPTMHDSADVLSNVDRIETSEMDVLKEEGQDQGIAHEDDLMAASSRDTLLNGTPDNDSETVAVNEDSLEGESEQEAVLVATSSEMDRDDALSGSDMKIAASSDRTDTGEDVDFPGSDMKVADSSDRTDTGEDVNPSQEGDRDVSHGASDFYIDLHFGLNSHTIDTRTSMQLESLTTGKALSIQSVEGASDTIGPRAFNDDLALRRAQAVLGSLGQAGALEAVGVGEVATSPASNARRVRLGVAVSEEGLTKDGAEQRILIFHRFAQAEPDPEFLPLLSDIATFLTDHEGVGVKITSHTDYRGGAEYNMALSSKRADAVQGYLLERGVSKQQIKALWLGETQLYSGCEGSKPCDSHSLATDRRSELEFFKR